MSAQPAESMAPRLQGAVEELERLILARYPGATFRVARSPDDPAVVDLLAAVDLDDPDVVLDVVVDRMMELQIAEGLPIFVIPVRTPERVASMRAASG